MLDLKNLIRLAAGATAIACAPAVASAQTADYVMHEWGLVSFMELQAEFLTSGHGARVVIPSEVQPVISTKPIIYLTPGPTFAPATTISATISIPQGYLHEIYPLAPTSMQPVLSENPTYTWNSISLMSTGCGPEGSPTVHDAPCIALGPGAICEAAELPLYLRPVDACLQADGMNAPILLWNAVNANWPSPVHVDVTSQLPTVTNTSADPVGGVFVRAGEGVQYLGALAPGATAAASVDALSLVTQAQLIDAVRAELLGQGLSANEAEDFIDAWRPDQLAFPPPWTALGFFDTTTIEMRAPLTLVPEPTERVRVLAFAAN